MKATLPVTTIASDSPIRQRDAFWISDKRFLPKSKMIEPIDREVLDVGQRRIPGAEIVDRDAHPQLVKPTQVRRDRFGIGHHDAFGELEIEPAGIEPGFRQRLGHQQGHALLAKLHGRKVDADAQRRKSRTLPRFRVAAGLPQYPFVDRDDQPILFGSCQKLARTDDAAPGPPPAQQRLGPDDVPGLHVHLRLIIQHELVVLNRPGRRQRSSASAPTMCPVFMFTCG